MAAADDEGPLQIRLVGERYEPRDREGWRRATPDARARWWSLLAATAKALMDRQLAAGLDKRGRRMKPVQLAYRAVYESKRPVDGPPLTPNRATSRTRRLLKARVLQAGVVLHWGKAWGEILRFHANGIPSKRGKIKRDVGGLAPRYQQRLLEEMHVYWTTGKVPDRVSGDWGGTTGRPGKIGIDLAIDKGEGALVRSLDLRTNRRVEVRRVEVLADVETGVRGPTATDRVSGWRQVITRRDRRWDVEGLGVRPRTGRFTIDPSGSGPAPALGGGSSPPRPTPTPTPRPAPRPRPTPAAIAPPPLRPVPPPPPLVVAEPPPVPTTPIPPGPIVRRVERYLAEGGQARIDAARQALADHAQALAAAEDARDAAVRVVARSTGGERQQAWTQLDAAVAVLRDLERRDGPAIVAESLAAPRPSTVKLTGDDVTPRHQAVADWIGRLLHDADVEVPVTVSAEQRRAAYGQWSQSVKMAALGEPDSTLAHELGHAIEDRHRETILARLVEWRYARTDGLETRPMRDFGDHHPEWERYWRGLIQPTPGLEESTLAYASSRFDNPNQVELFSVGLELLRSHPAAFLAGDRQWVGLILGLLDGRLR